MRLKDEERGLKGEMMQAGRTSFIPFIIFHKFALNLPIISGVAIADVNGASWLQVI